MKTETVQKIREMLKELGWSDEVINQYFMSPFDDFKESQVMVNAEKE